MSQGDNKRAGEEAVARVLLRLTERGFDCAMPAGDNAAWDLINQIDPIVYQKQTTEIEDKVRKPLRQLSTDWRINVKMTDSVTEGKYALCRKALTSLDTWAREVKDNQTASTQKQADYERDKAQCKDAIDNPALGNTSPK